MSQYLLFFTFSPVQAFISQGRKTQDAYAGSFILSHLCGIAIAKATKDYNADVIFPSSNNKARPNRFVALVENSNQDYLKSMGEGIEKAVRDEFEVIGKGILQELGFDNNSQLCNVFFDQLRSYLQVFWVFEEIIENNYERAYSAGEAKLGIIKNIRAFDQIEEEGGRKCLLTGEHNVLLFRGKKKAYVAVPPAVSVDQVRKATLRHLRDGEGLGALGAMKRFAGFYFKNNHFQANFPSIAEIALFNVMDELSKKGNSEKALVEAISMNSIDFDYQAVFDYLNEEVVTDERVLKICKLVRSHEIPVTPYYAVVMFDGDSMGKVLSGEILKENVDLKRFHKELTSALGDYASHAVSIVEKPKGKVVYAGGEDFLAFLNLSYLFESLQDLRTSFDNISINKGLKEKLTFSTGVVVAHYKTPLSEVLKWARNMEKEAKEKDSKKNNLGIAVLKHSGEVEKALYRWTLNAGSNQGEIWTTELLNALIENKKNFFSDSFVRHLALEFNKLENSDSVIMSGVTLKKIVPNATFTEYDVVMAEMKRLVERSWLSEDISTGNDKKMIINELTALLKTLFINKYTMADFLSILKIATFIESRVSGYDN